MPLRDELIQRAIEQLAVSFARLLARTGASAAELDSERGALNASEAAAVRQQLDRLYSTFMGSSSQLVLRLSSDDLVRVLGSAGFVDGERAYLLSSLLETEAQLLVSQGAGGAEDAVLGMRGRALDLMLEAGLAALGEADLGSRVARLLDVVPADVRPPSTWERLVWYRFEAGDFAGAEDALYAWLDEEQADGSEVVAASTAGAAGGEGTLGMVGSKLYGRLAALDDAVLERGGLPREELAEGEAELGRRLGS